MAYADFRGKPTYFAVFKMMISSKNVNQNMLKIPYFLKLFFKFWQALKIPPPDPNWFPAAGGSVSRPPPHAILPTPTVLLQNVLSLSSFLMKAHCQFFTSNIINYLALNRGPQKGWAHPYRRIRGGLDPALGISIECDV